MHVDTMSASVFTSCVGTVKPAGTFAPGALPVVGFASCEASVNAIVSAGASSMPDPTAVPELIYGASAATAATVVTSFTVTNDAVCSAAHDPSATISARFGFTPPASPGFPPVAVRYTSVVFAHGIAAI